MNLPSTVLYIEDNPNNLELVEAMMKRVEHINLLTEKTGQTGLESAIKNCPDLVLLDINLPDFDGLHILEKLRELNTTKHIPVIAISANAMLDDINASLAAGFDQYVTKPFNLKSLMTLIEEYIQS